MYWLIDLGTQNNPSPPLHRIALPPRLAFHPNRLVLRWIHKRLVTPPMTAAQCQAALTANTSVSRRENEFESLGLLFAETTQDSLSPNDKQKAPQESFQTETCSPSPQLTGSGCCLPRESLDDGSHPRCLWHLPLPVSGLTVLPLDPTPAVQRHAPG